MKKIIYLLICGFLFANSLNEQFLTQSGIETEKNKRQIFVDNYEEVTMEHLKASQKANLGTISAKSEKLYYQASNNQNATPNSNVNINTNVTNPASVNSEQPFYVRGYCYLNHDIEITRLSSYAMLKCNFDYGNGKLAVLFVPDVYSKAVIGKPLYILFDSRPDRRYFISGGVVMNAEQTSINLANIVNDRKIDKFLANVSITSADIVTKQAMDYLKAKQAANTQEQITYIQNSDGTTTPVKTTQTNQPKLSDYVAVTTAQLISNLIKLTGNVFYKDLPYFFKINKGNVYYVDLYVDPNYKGLPNINKPTNNLVVKNPPESQEKPSQINFSGQSIQNSNNTINNK